MVVTALAIAAATRPIGGRDAPCGRSITSASTEARGCIPVLRHAGAFCAGRSTEDRDAGVRQLCPASLVVTV